LAAAEVLVIADGGEYVKAAIEAQQYLTVGDTIDRILA
jgi:hypothetical protein